MHGDPVERKGEAAGRTLERQDENDDGGAIEEQHEQQEEHGQRIEREGAALVHRHSSLRMSTMRFSTVMMSMVAPSRITALAAAGGNCRALSRVSMALPAEAICSPPITPKVMKSPMTMVTTKIEPMAMPGFDSGMMTLVSICQPVAPAS